MHLDRATCARIRANPAFVELERKRFGFSLALAVAMLAIYFGFIGLVAFAPSVLARPVSGVVTLGFPLGLLVIVSAVALTGAYVARANSAFDRLTRDIVEGSR